MALHQITDLLLYGMAVVVRARKIWSNMRHFDKFGGLDVTDGILKVKKN